MKPIKTLTLVASALGALCCAPAASAATHDGTISFTGKVVASTCQMQVDQVDLGTKSANFFNGLENIEGDLKDVTLNITDCAPHEKGHLAFSGTQDAGDNTIFGATGPANIGIALYAPDGTTPIPATVAPTASDNVPYDDSNTPIVLKAAMHKTSTNPVGAGSLNGTISVDFFSE